MKLKRTPEDFQVEELADVAIGDGPFALYRLTKRSLGTPEAMELVQRRWKLQRRQLSYGGLKDRHALTHQFVTIHRGPARDMQQDQLRLEYLGRCPRPFTAADIRANRFRIIVRDLSDAEMTQALQSVATVERDGLPNYFDDQRFGSLGESGEFLAAAWCRGDYERALWLALAEPNPHDRASEREQKRILRDLWGQWAECKASLERSHRRSIITFLADRPGDFRGALARIRVDLRGLYLSAFQSAVWNRLLSQVVREVVTTSRTWEVNLDSGPARFFNALHDDERLRLAHLKIPLPAARARHEMGDFTETAERVLADFGMTLQSMRVKYPRDSFFSKGLRTAIYHPANVDAQSAPDDLYPGRQALCLAFDLPRGSYATILVKGIGVG